MKKTKAFALIFLVLAIVSFAVSGRVIAQENGETIDVVENVDIEFLVLGVLAGLLYAFLGWCASGEDFEPTKFFRTFAIVTLIALGLDLSNVTFDVYSAMLEPMAITVFLEKLLNTATSKAKT